MLLSIILPCRNEEKYIREAIESVYKTSISETDFELIIVDGMSNDKTTEIIKEFKQIYKNLFLLKNENITVPYAMNLGIKQSRGDYIIRIDAHCIYPDNYFEELIKWHKELDADNVGCALITDTQKKSRTSEAISIVLSDKFGVGNSYFRIGVEEVKAVDTVPFGCFKRTTFKKYGLYDVRLKRSQDIELNKRIVSGGGKIFLIPKMKLIYYARDTFKSLAKKYIENGKWNVLVAYYTKKLKSLSIRNFIPALFIILLLFSILISLKWRIALFFPALYLITILSRSIQLGLIKNKSVIHLVLVFIILHFSHGIGAITGLISLLNPKHRKIRNDFSLEKLV